MHSHSAISTPIVRPFHFDELHVALPLLPHASSFLAFTVASFNVLPFAEISTSPQSLLPIMCFSLPVSELTSSRRVTSLVLELRSATFVTRSVQDRTGQDSTLLK